MLRNAEYQPGATFEGKYQIEQTLGAGGFALVYGATDVTTGRKVALKIIHRPPGGYDADIAGRFEREIRIVSALRDPHSVTMFDFGTSQDGLLFMVFELVPGEDLSALLDRRGTLSEAEVVHILTQVLSALREAHGYGLLHRDIKPDNIRVFTYLDDPLRAKLLDFGIARPTTHQHSALTQPGQLIGTPRYMSPEQLLEQPLTPAADLYSLGLVAIELLGSGGALAGNSFGEQMDRLQNDFVFPLPNVSSGMAEVLRALTARDPQRRYPSTAEALQAVRALRGSHVVDMSTDSRRATTAQTAGRRPSSVSTAALVTMLGALCVALFAAIIVITTREPVPQPPPPTRRAIPLATAPNVKAAAQPQPKEVVEPVDAGNACDAWDGGHGELTMSSSESVGFDWPIYVPRGYTGARPRPVMFLFHDAWQQVRGIGRNTGFMDLAEQHGILLVFPRAPESIDGQGLWANVWEEASDLAGIDEMWRETRQQLCVDEQQVFAVGHAAGGYAVERLPCLTQVPFAAGATMSHIKGMKDPVCAKPLPMMVLLGKTDEYVPREGGNNCNGYVKHSWKQKRNRLADANGCSGERKSYLDHPGGQCSTWRCKSALVFCELEGGREWPGTQPQVWDRLSGRNCSGQAADFPAVSTVWKFFQENPLKQDPTTRRGDSVAGSDAGSSN